ncbi:PREDICTED: open rectifier potassium channel protein 1 isoform X2 [Bactrocera latifrons]|uniref:Open rectifier potassium channel protein 1 n=4 Tax=Bactrocera latifrons TaxID=174628 RepID=A0A0K8W2I0_BACLA|nr:PREDICTED: open rectifier potassium channel protein 1 isoform X2 [Bactrocera latifrons]XP_018797057.1 PREDICTED: open rectifier potassium channel protein 1 isoform X2 [Bactrocera latifrons]
MSPRRWILLLIFYIAYLMFGASIYYHIEHGIEKQQRATDLRERIEMNEYLVSELSGKNESTVTEILENISDYCGKKVTNYTADEFEPPYTWTFYHSFFFAFTVCSTVGYGNIYPTTLAGRLIMIFYSIIGIPVNGILFAGLGDYFGKTFELIYRRYKKFKLSRDKHYVPPQLGLLTAILIALIPGIGIFILLPALVFTYFEKWSYSISIYFAYVTTTTIGFGDFVPTFGPDQPREFGAWFVVYEIFVIMWFIFALGYLVMIMGFITRGLQSKKLRRLEQQLSTNIKTTQNRIWSGVTKDVGHLRRILNELYILRVKPVYNEPDPTLQLHRSNSAPELTMYREDTPPEFPRKRAFSETYDVIEARSGLAPIHASSDTALDKLDKQKSFQDADAFLQTTELLAKVVGALGAVRVPPPEEDEFSMYGGYHGLSDSQILASEWSYPSIHEAPKPRGRANSDYNFEPPWRQRRPTALPTEWTWSGDNERIQEAINNRYKEGDSRNLYRSSFGLPPREYVVNMEEDEPPKPRVKKFSMPDGLRKLFPSKKRPSQERITAAEAGTDVSMPNGTRRFSIMSVPESARRAPPLDYYSTVAAEANAPYYGNGKLSGLPGAPSSYPSDGSLTSKQPSGALNGLGAGARRGSNAAVGGGPRKRRESIFTQKPSAGVRRGSLFPTSNAAGLTQRRGSLFTSGMQPNTVTPSRRGSLFPTSGRAAADRRPSLFSVASEEEREVLENTTIADLIRALEVMHTQTVMEEAADSPPAITHSDMGGIFGGSNKQRKMGNAGMDLPDVPPLFSLFSNDNKRAMNSAAANRLYARRSTVVGALPTSFNAPTGSTTTLAASGPTSMLTRRRKSSAVQQIPEPPPSYSERDTNVSSTTNSTTTPSNKFKRRFSVRPTALQIPPGKAPPPGANMNIALASQNIVPAAPTLSSASTQSVLQRRLSLRPSPLARELNISTSTSSASSSSDPSPTSPTGSGGTVTSTTRLLPSTSIPTPAVGAATRPPTTGSTHSPLSRIVQIAQAQRKSSMQEGFPLERTQKPDDV